MKERWSRSKDWYYKQVDAAKVVQNLEKSTNGRLLPPNERQARELASLVPTQQIQVWEEITNRYEPTEITPPALPSIGSAHLPMPDSQPT